MIRTDGEYWFMISVDYARQPHSHGQRVGWLQQIHIVRVDLILSPADIARMEC